MNVTQVRLGVAGCGRMFSLVHASNLQRERNVNVVALCDSSPQSLTAAQEAFPKARAVPSLSELLEQDLDAVMLCLPNHEHCQAALACREQDKHCYMEKPLASTLEEAMRIQHAWNDSTRVAMVGFNSRFHPLYRKLKGLLDAEALGPIFAIRAVRTTQRRTMPAWKTQRILGGGILLDHACHTLDLVRFLTGLEFQRVQCRLESRHSEDDTAMLALDLKGILMQGCFSYGPIEQDEVEIFGERGRVKVDRLCGVRLDWRSPRPRPPLARLLDWDVSLLPKLWRSGFDPSYRLALATFLQACQGVPSGQYADFAAGVANLAALEAAQASAKQGVTVTMA
jgi:predicted dehydrogenase